MANSAGFEIQLVLDSLSEAPFIETQQPARESSKYHGYADDYVKKRNTLPIANECRSASSKRGPQPNTNRFCSNLANGLLTKLLPKRLVRHTPLPMPRFAYLSQSPLTQYSEMDRTRLIPGKPFQQDDHESVVIFGDDSVKQPGNDCFYRD